MKKLLLITGLIFLFLAAPSAKAYQPLCAGYEHGGVCDTTPCTTDQLSDGTCSDGPCLNAAASAACKDAATETKSGTNPAIHTIGTAVKILLLICGFAAVIMIAVSGLTMIFSGGNAQAVEESRKRMTGAAIGLVIAALAYTIITYALRQIL